MPTYATVKFIKDKLDKGNITKEGIVWDILFCNGEVRRIHISEASKHVSEGYAIYI